MNRFTPTRSLATAVMGVLGLTLLSLLVAMPFTSVRPITVLYVAMLVTGIGMFLRERVFPPATQPVRVEARHEALSFTNV